MSYVKIEKTTTGLIIHDGSDFIKTKILEYFSLSNPLREFFIYSGNDKTKKPIFGKNHDVIYITSGILDIKDDKLKKELKHYKTIPTLSPKHIDLKIDMKPRSQLQEDCINKMISSNTTSKLTIELRGGTGKSFITVYAISKLGLKPLIIAPTSLLKNQWIEYFTDNGIPLSDIATNIYDGPNKKITVVTISALSIELNKDWSKLLNVIKESRYGVKVIDEAHLSLKSVMRFDAICNIPRNWYLSATLGRSSTDEDSILNRLFLDADRFIGDGRYKEYQHQYINIYLQDIYYNPSTQLCKEYFKFGTKGLIKASYYNMLMNYKNGVPFINNILKMLKIAKKTETYNGKVLLLLPMLDIIDTVIKYMKRDPFFKNNSISQINGKMNLSERELAKESDYILSTTQSVGTGIDIKNLGCVINMDQAASAVITEQVVVRLRDRGKECWYFDVCDHVRQARSFENWGRQRRTIFPYIPGVYPDMKKLPDIRS